MKKDTTIKKWKEFLSEVREVKTESGRIDELNRYEIDSIANNDGDFILHNFRTANEIMAGTIALLGIKDGEMVFRISPFGNGHPRVPNTNANWRNAQAGQWDTSPSTPRSNSPYLVRLKFNDWDDVMEMDLPPRDKALMLIGKDAEFNDISLHCSCPSFKFHYQYVASQKGASIEPES